MEPAGFLCVLCWVDGDFRYGLRREADEVHGILFSI